MVLGFNDGSIHIVDAVRTELTGVYSMHKVKQAISSGDYDANDLHAGSIKADHTYQSNQSNMCSQVVVRI